MNTFFFNDTATTEIYTLSLHDALPISQKKAYTIDQGLSTIISYTLSKDTGRLFETVVFLELRKKYNEIFYYKDKGECDFIIKEKNKITKAYQVCLNINDDNREREFRGLTNAIERFKLKKGTIITLNQKESFKNIEIIPAFEWILNNKL